MGLAPPLTLIAQFKTSGIGNCCVTNLAAYYYMVHYLIQWLRVTSPGALSRVPLAQRVLLRSQSSCWLGPQPSWGLKGLLPSSFSALLPEVSLAFHVRRSKGLLSHNMAAGPFSQGKWRESENEGAPQAQPPCTPQHLCAHPLGVILDGPLAIILHVSQNHGPHVVDLRSALHISHSCRQSEPSPKYKSDLVTGPQTVVHYP